MGGSILAQVNQRNQRPVDIGAVTAWHNVFVQKHGELAAPGGGRWNAGEQVSKVALGRAIRRGGKALSSDKVPYRLTCGVGHQLGWRASWKGAVAVWTLAGLG